MMFWFGDGMTGWGYPVMATAMVLAWWLIGFGVYALVRYLGHGTWSAPSPLTPEQVLAERFARGEIDAQEFHDRLSILDGCGRPVGKY
jgi:putative membrane protein